MTPCWDVSQFSLIISYAQNKNNKKTNNLLCFNNSDLFFSLPDDRHRVKLHPLLGDPNSDYINANYIDVSLSLFLLLPFR